MTLKLSDEDANAVLERAARIDGRSTGFTVDELSQAARGAGISDEAFARAIVELGQERRPVSASDAVAPAPVKDSTSWWGPVLAAVAGATAGVLMDVGPNDLVGVLAVGLSTIGLGFRVFDHRRTHTLRKYLLEATALWAAFPLTAGMVVPFDSEETLLFAAVAWMVSSAAGALLIRTGRSAQQPSDGV